MGRRVSCAQPAAARNTLGSERAPAPNKHKAPAYRSGAS
jgi:hypothetical protein